jgi:hypothetical protein
MFGCSTDKYQIVEVSTPPDTRFSDVGGTINVDTTLTHDLGAQISGGARIIHQENTLLLDGTRWHSLRKPEVENRFGHIFTWRDLEAAPGVEDLEF